MNDTVIDLPASIMPRHKGKRTCDQCAHYAMEDDAVCRRYPPTVTILLVPIQIPMAIAPNGARPMAPKPFASYPPINPEHPCGEFRVMTARGD